MPPRYTDEFRIDAVRQVTINNYSIVDTAQRLGVHPDSLRSWIKRFGVSNTLNNTTISHQESVEIRRLQKELRRVTEERDIFLCLHSL